MSDDNMARAEDQLSDIGEAANKEEGMLGDGFAAKDLHAPLAHKVIFIVMGTAELFVWNAVLSILWDIREKIYPEYPSMTDTLNAVNNVANLAVASYCVYTGAMNQVAIVLSGFVMGGACIALAITTQWARGMNGVIWFHVINFVSGAACGMYQTGGYGLASALPVPATGYVSTGQGVSGITAWVLWMVISKATKLNVTQAMWVMMSIGCCICIFSNFCYIALLRRPEVRVRVKEVQKTLRDEATNPEAPSYRFLLKHCAKHIFTIWYNLFITLFFFPNIGPLGWKDGDFTDYVMGAFQVGDLIGRYSPNLLKFLLLKPMPLLCAVLGRTILLPLAMVSYFKHENSFWGNNAFHFILMATLAITNGWFASNVFMNTPFVIKDEGWRSRVGSMVVVGLLTGIACGLWSARIFTAVAE